MTITSALIAEGFREANFTAQGGTLETPETAEGLGLLQGLLDTFFPVIVGTKLMPWWIPYPNRTAPEGRSYPAFNTQEANRSIVDTGYPPSNARVILRNTAVQTVYFQYQPEDGALMEIVDAGIDANVTLDANGNLFGTTGYTRTEVIEPVTNSRRPTRTYCFRQDIASWVQINDLVATDEFPLPSIFDDYFTTALAVRLSSRFGNEPRSATVARYKEMVTFARGYYRQTAEALNEGAQRTHQNYQGTSFGRDYNDNGGF